MQLCLLGPLAIIDDDGQPVEIRGAKLNALLVLLALRAGEVVPTGGRSLRIANGRLRAR